MATAEANGATIAYDDTGGDGPVVILGHGFLMDRTMFAEQVAALRDRYRVITWDERGFGDTVYDGKPFNYWDLAADCLSLMDALGIDDAVLGGMSQGGFIALRSALLAPGRVRALILLDTQAGPEDADVIPVYKGMIDDWAENGPSDAIAEITASIIIGDPALSAVWIPRWKAPPGEAIRNPGAALLERESIADRLGEITVPALVVHGTADVAISMDKAEAMAASLVGCSGVVAVDGGTHATNMTHPGPTNDAILAFLEGLPD
jgi:3-oxoadipate enol-lactonase